MTALDTNIIVRFLVRDDEKQAQIVYTMLKRAETNRETLFVPLLVVLEIIWVLESAYDKSRDEILDSLDTLRMVPILKFEGSEVIQNLLTEGRRSKVDLSDLLISLTAQSSGCSDGITFDKKASKLPFFRLLG